MTQHTLQYVKLLPADPDIPALLGLHSLPEIARFIHIDQVNYFNYVTSSDGVFYFKVYLEGQLAGTVQPELDGGVLYLSLLTVPEYQKRGIASQILQDIKSGMLIREFSEIRVSVDRDNAPSLRLFEKSGFTLSGEEDDLLDYVWIRPSGNDSINEPYYMAYEKRYRAVFAAGAERWGHSPEDPVLVQTLEKWVEENHLSGKCVIEYACGEGACGVILSRLGCIWHGVDVSPAAVEKAQEAVREFPDASVQVLDMVKDTAAGPYDAALDCMGFHMLVTDADRSAYLKHACSSLRDGAPMLFFRQSYRSDGDPRAVHKGVIRSIEEWEAVTGSDYSTPQLRRTFTDSGEIEVFIPLVPARANDRDGYIAEMEGAGFAVEKFEEMDESEAIRYSASISVRKPHQGGHNAEHH